MPNRVGVRSSDILSKLFDHVDLTSPDRLKNDSKTNLPVMVFIDFKIWLPIKKKIKPNGEIGLIMVKDVIFFKPSVKYDVTNTQTKGKS